MQVSAAPSPRTARPGATRFFLGIAVVMVVFMFVGFGRSLYLRPILGTVDRFGPHLPMHLIAQIVQNPDVIAMLQQLIREMRPNETGSSCY